MAGWDDLVKRAQPRLLNLRADFTAGTDWAWTLSAFKDSLGNPVDLSTATFECKVIDLGSAPVATWTVTGAVDGTLSGTLDDATTAALSSGATIRQARKLHWYCTGTKAGAGVQV